jgi:hypothetical protein
MSEADHGELEVWLTRLAGVLDVDVATVDPGALLDLARDAAHSVARPAAPLTTFLVGLAAGRAGGDAAAVAAALASAHALLAEQ